MRPASVVLASVLDSILFKAFQFFRGVKRRLLLFTCESCNELHETFHVFSAAGSSYKRQASCLSRALNSNLLLFQDLVFSCFWNRRSCYTNISQYYQNDCFFSVIFVNYEINIYSSCYWYRSSKWLFF